jgi:hypothetical protein
MTGSATPTAATVSTALTPAQARMRNRPGNAVEAHAPAAVDTTPASTQNAASAALLRRRPALPGSAAVSAEVREMLDGLSALTGHSPPRSQVPVHLEARDTAGVSRRFAPTKLVVS